MAGQIMCEAKVPLAELRLLIALCHTPSPDSNVHLIGGKLGVLGSVSLFSKTIFKET
jgi:hypothetical protein